jgi:hypothetical protein
MVSLREPASQLQDGAAAMVGIGSTYAATYAATYALVDTPQWIVFDLCCM